jgi:hypothetical protein
MRFSTLLAFATATAAAALPQGETAVSPDGYTYAVEPRSYVPETITLADGTTTTVHVHPDFKFVKRDEIPGTTPNKVAKRLSWFEGYPDQCGHSSFVGKSSDGSPKTVDCKAISTYYRTANGMFVAYPIGDLSRHWCRLVITGSCVFGIKSKNTFPFRVGSLDIADITRDAMASFKTSGSPSRTGAEGTMGCTLDKYTTDVASVNWAIFHS